ncbi:MAG: dipeptidase [Acidobacteriia bacterium]|nr:dipeptidase [Terriglobia bacterium]
MKKTARNAVLGMIALLVLFFTAVPPLVDRGMNKLTAAGGQPGVLRKDAAALHATLRVADLHADSLLWGRDLTVHGSRGHVDVPRMIEGGVTVQIFTAVTKTPRGLNYERNSADSDTIIWLALAQRWPPRTWNDLTERALFLAGRFDRTVATSGGRLAPIRTARDLQAYLADRKTGAMKTAGILGIEGAHALNGKLENLDRLYDASYRIISLTHFFDDEFAGSSAGVEKGGLTPLGRELVRRMNEKRVIIDLAHASPQTIADVLALAKRPVIYSHGGLKGTCNNRRNLSDDEARGIARSGGLIGIGFWETAVCGKDAHAVARALRYAVNLVGAEHVALGSDFDGATTVPFDSAHLVELTNALLDAGFREDEIRAVMGENALRFLAENLPQ